MEILTMNRYDACKYVLEHQNDKILVVSISSSDDIAPQSMIDIHNSRNKNIKFEFLYFDDIDCPTNGLKEISDSDAERVAYCVMQNKDVINKILVHCDAGYSRSAGVSAAIGKYLNNDDSEWFNSRGLYHPNMLCYHKVLEKFCELRGR